MNNLGIPVTMKNRPMLDETFVPAGAWMRAYLKEADQPISIGIEREDGRISVFRRFLRGEAYAEANERYLERTVKLLLWCVGGFRVYLSGCGKAGEHLKQAYRREGARAFDVDFMETVYERPFEVVLCDAYLIIVTSQRASQGGCSLIARVYRHCRECNRCKILEFHCCYSCRLIFFFLLCFLWAYLVIESLHRIGKVFFRVF